MSRGRMFQRIRSYAVSFCAVVLKNPSEQLTMTVRVKANAQRRIDMDTTSTSDWRDRGVRVIPGSQLDLNTAQTPGMTRAAAITHARTGANKLWAGTVVVEPDAKTGAHHHGELETVLYIVRGRARFRWGENLEYFAEADPGDFIYVPPYVPHQEMNASPE